MRLVRIKAENFGPFGAPGVDLHLSGQGLVAVVGRNETDAGFDANGVGKSSVLDAIMWGLFGETGTRRASTTSDSGLKGDEVINEKAGKDCVVEVVFERDDGVAVRVRRWRKAKIGADKRGSGVDVFEYVGESWTVVANLDKDNVQAAIDKRLGFDAKLFAQCVIRGQEDTFTFAQATPSERFAILTQIEGLEELDAWDARFRARGRLLAHELAVLQGDVRSKEQSLTVYAEQAQRDANAAALWETDRGSRLAALEHRRVEGRAYLAGVEDRLAQKGAGEARLAEVDAALAGLVAPSKPPELTAWEAHAHDLQGRLGAAKGERDRLASKIARLASQREGECDACGQPITAAHLELHRSQLAVAVGSTSQALEVLSGEVENAQRVIRTAGQHLEAARSVVQSQRGQLEYERGQILSALGAARAEEGNRVRAVELLTRIEADIVATASAVNPVGAVATDRADMLARLEADLTATKGVEAQKASENGLCEWWVRNIPSLKSWIFDSAVGEITKEANRWLSVLTGGLCWVEVSATATTKAGEVRDKIALKCMRWNPDGTIAEREFRQWSGGEKRRIALALDWALAARLSQRAKGVCTFLALDEVDRHLDAAGRSGLLSALDILRREKDTVVCITHDTDMRAKPDTTWLVTKKATGSVVEVLNGRQDQDQV